MDINQLFNEILLLNVSLKFLYPFITEATFYLFLPQVYCSETTELELAYGCCNTKWAFRPVLLIH